MQLNKISPLPNFSISKINIRIYKKLIPVEKQKKLIELINISDSIHEVNDVIVYSEIEIDPRYVADIKRIYIPLDYKNSNEKLHKMLEGLLKNNFEDFIIFHEMGHAVEVDRKHDIHQIHIKNFQGLNYLFNGKDVIINGKYEKDPINQFLIESYKEGFADCYAGICYYKKHGDFSIFDKITQARELRYAEMKKDKGSNYLHVNFNTNSPMLLKEKIIDLQKNGIDFFSLQFCSKKENMEKYIEEAVVKGCIQTLVKELEVNDVFLFNFKNFGKQLIKDNSEYKISTVHNTIKDYALNKNIECSNLIEKLNVEAILPYFLAIEKNTSNIILTDLGPITKESIISKEILISLVENEKLTRKIDLSLINNVENENKKINGVSKLEDNLPIKSIESMKMNMLCVRNNLLENNKQSVSKKFNM